MKSPKILKIFSQKNCPHCPPAKELGKRLKEKVKVENYELEEINGLTQARFYDILATPTLILTNRKGKEIKRWQGTPAQKEIEDCL